VDRNDLERRTIMTTITRTLLALVLTATWAVPAAAQSANRTASGVPRATATNVIAMAERPEISSCRRHCGALAATARNRVMPNQTVVERLAQNTRCARKMLPR
jgi:hypothetical protein